MVRRPAVAGHFYPKKADELRSIIRGMADPFRRGTARHRARRIAASPVLFGQGGTKRPRGGAFPGSPASFHPIFEPGILASPYLRFSSRELCRSGGTGDEPGGRNP